MNFWRTQVGLMLCCFGMLLSGCAQVPPGAGADPKDPWESLNRQTFAFNETVDSYVLHPVAKGYERVVPENVREGVHNMYVNLGEPGNVLNNALQGKPEGALVSLFRFMINSTLGLGGVFDVAGSAAGQAVQREDFGQTLAVWGVPNGPYVVLPFLGPSTVRDSIGLPVEYALAPMTYADLDWVEWGMWGVFVVDARVQLLPVTDLLKDAVDPYLMAREGYLANRKNAVWDGNPPFEFPKDEFEDEEASADVQ